MNNHGTNVPKFIALEMETSGKVCGYYYLENGYFMNCCEPDLSKPVERHYIVDVDGQHREIDPATLEPA